MYHDRVINVSSKLQKVFLCTYFLVFISILFLRDSNIVRVLSSSTVNKLYYLMLFVGILINIFIMLYINMNKINNSLNIFLSFLYILLFLVPLFFSSKLLPLAFVFFIVTAMNSKIVDPHKFIKTDFYMRMCLVIITIFLMLIHVLPSTTSFRNGVSRVNLGFSGPNSFAVIVLSLFVSYFLMKRHVKHFMSVLLVLLLIYLFVYFLTNTRQFQILGLLLIFCFCMCHFLNYKKIANIISKIGLAVTTIFSVIISLLFPLSLNLNNPFFMWINSISSNRIILQYQAFIDYPIRLFGYKNMPLIGLKGDNIDNFFTSDLLHCGLLGFIIIVITFIYYIVKSIKYGDRFTNIGLIIIMLAFLTIYTDELYAPIIYVASFVNYKELNSFKDIQKS